MLSLPRTTPAGTIKERLVDDLTDVVTMRVQTLPQLAVAAVVALVSLVWVALISPWALAWAVVGSLATTLPAWAVKQWAERAYEETTDAEAAIDAEYFQARDSLDLIRTERLQDYVRARVRRLDDQHLRVGTMAEVTGAAEWGLSNLVQATALYGSLLLVLWLVATGRVPFTEATGAVIVLRSFFSLVGSGASSLTDLWVNRRKESRLAGLLRPEPEQQVEHTDAALAVRDLAVRAGGAVLAAHGLMDAGSVVGAAVLVAPVQAALEAVTTAIGSWRAREIVSRRLGWLVVDDGAPAGGTTVAEHPAEDDGAGIRTLELRSIVTLLPNGRRTTPVSASLAHGDVLWLRGNVGSGKTSLVRALIGLGADLDGELLIDGAAGELTPGRVLLMPQAPSFLSGTVTENITLDRPDLEAAARGRLAVAGMERLADQALEPGGPSLSGGERHVVAWLRHLRRTGGVRVLDEPLNGLSPETSARVMDEIEASRSDWITILISHDDRPARMPGAQVVLLDG